MFTIAELVLKFTERLENYEWPKAPSGLYDPIRYILQMGGKSLRPALVLAGYNIYEDDIDSAFEAAMAVEVFHNFTLMHDDIMDDADIRRSMPSVHKQFDINTAILSGDAMLIYVYKLLESYEDKLGNLVSIMTKTAIEVCEGQRHDMDNERRDEVTIDDYILMISYKTAVLVGCALQMGSIIGGASQKDQFHLYNFGMNLGIAFQVQDDWLDCFGNESQVGKKIGGDILQNKKTYLYLKSLELLSNTQAARLKQLYSTEALNSRDDKIEEVISLFSAAHVSVHCEEFKLVYQQLAFSHLDAISVDSKKKKILKSFGEKLLNRAN